MRKLLTALLLILAAPTLAQSGYQPQPDLTQYAKLTDLSAVQALANKGCRLIYASSGSVTVGNNSTARSTMLPPALANGSLTVPANAMPPGATLHVVGSGVISATTVGSPTFTFTPWVTPAGGSKTDLPGFSAAPLIGVVGITWLDVQITQTATGLDTGGIVSYAQTNSANNYPNPVNNAGTIMASDYTVARTFGFDGQWSVANAADYVTPQQVTIYLCPPGA